MYEMMGLALAGQNDTIVNNAQPASSSSTTAESSSSSAAEDTPAASEVVEASEVLTENDPWQS